MFYKRLCDVYEDEIRRLSEEFGSVEIAKTLARADRKLIRFYVPDEYTWREIRKVTKNLGERLTLALREIAKENPKLQGVIDIVDFATAAGQTLAFDSRVRGNLPSRFHAPKEARWCFEDWRRVMVRIQECLRENPDVVGFFRWLSEVRYGAGYAIPYGRFLDVYYF